MFHCEDLDEVLARLDEHLPEHRRTHLAAAGLTWREVQEEACGSTGPVLLLVASDDNLDAAETERHLHRWIPPWRLESTALWSYGTPSTYVALASLRAAGPLLEPMPGSLVDAALRPDLVGRVQDAGYPDHGIELSASQPPRLRALFVHGLAVPCRGRWVPTVAGLILCGFEPDRELRGCRIEATVQGVREVVAGPAPELVAWARSKAPRHEDAVELMAELVVNALLHRDWSRPARNEPVRVLLEGDRLEVRSPGVDRSRGGGSPNHGGSLLHGAAAALGLCDGAGDGLSLARRRMVAGGFPAPVLSEEAGWVVVRAVLPRPTRPVPAPWASPPAAPQALASFLPAPAPPPPAASSGVAATPTAARPRSARQGEVERFARAVDHGLSVRELADALGWTHSTTRSVVAAMVAAGRLAPAEGKTRSPVQRYRLVGEEGGPASHHSIRSQIDI